MSKCGECDLFFPSDQALRGHLKLHRRGAEMEKARIISEENARLRARLAKYEPEAAMGPGVGDDAEVED